MSLDVGKVLASLDGNKTQDKDGKEVKVEGKIYKDYLQLDNLLSNVDMMSAKHGMEVHDEHLFISEPFFRFH